MVDLTKRTSLLPSFLAGSETLFIGQGTDIAYIDFSGLKSQAIAVSANRTAVTVALAKAQLEPAVLNVSQSYVYAQQQGLFDRIGNFFSGNPNSQQKVYILAQQKIQAAAQQSPLLTEAQRPPPSAVFPSTPCAGTSGSACSEPSSGAGTAAAGSATATWTGCRC